MRLAHWIIVVTLPLVLMMLASRLVMTPAFLSFLYTRDGFPQDVYGFTTEDRLSYGVLGLQYLLERQPITFLSDQTLPGERCFPMQASECSMFNARELQHMVDVQNVTWLLFVAACVAAIICTASLWTLRRQRALLITAVEAACITLVVAVLTIAVAVVFAWDTFFDVFHALFFEEGTWRFFYSDTLIRLYPEQFWMDSAIAVGVLSVIFAIGLMALVRLYRVSYLRREHS